LRRTIGFLLLVVLSLAVLSASAEATPENADRTARSCDFCHPTGPPELGEAGLYYQEHGTLEGYGTIGVHLPQWDVSFIVFGTLISILIITYLIKL
jgi:hypothetical protein